MAGCRCGTSPRIEDGAALGCRFRQHRAGGRGSVWLRQIGGQGNTGLEEGAARRSAGLEDGGH
jgi:hypothetical protein